MGTARGPLSRSLIIAALVAALTLGATVPVIAAAAPDGPGALSIEKKPAGEEPPKGPPDREEGGKGRGRPSTEPTAAPSPVTTPPPSAPADPPAPSPEPTSPPAVPGNASCKITSVVIDANSRQPLLRPGDSASLTVRWHTAGKCASATVSWTTDQPGGTFSGSSSSIDSAATTFIAGGGLGSNWRIVATVTGAPGAATRSDSRFVDVKLDSALAAVAAAGRSGETAALAAVLTAAGSPLAGRTITFSALGRTVTGTTDASGRATAALDLTGTSAGSFSYAAAFTGDAQYVASATSAALVVAPADTTPPLVTAVVGGPMGADGWAIGDVVVSWLVSDEESAVTTVCGSTVITTDTAGRVVTCLATSLGGTTTTSVTVRRDATAPTIVADRTPANELGWTAGDVTVTFACSDALSGVAECPAPSTVSTEGAGQTVTVTGRDRAGNVRTTSVGGISIDRTPPTISATRTPAGPFGWNSGDVTIAFSCGDALAGILSCATPVTLSADGAGQTASGSAIDRAGNASSLTVAGVNIDRTPPEIAFAGLRTYGVDELVGVTCVASDGLSGIASVTCANGAGPAYAYVLWPVPVVATASDLAGNTAESSATVTVAVTTSGLCELTKRWSGGALGSSLCQKLANAAIADVQGDDKKKWDHINSYRKEVEAQSGKAFDPVDADVLIALSSRL